MSNNIVRLVFNAGAGDYVFPQVQSETGSNLPDEKVTIIEGTRGDGSLYIPGGKKSKRIVIRGILVGENYEDLTTQMSAMKTAIPTTLGVLKLQRHVGGSTWANDYLYNVRRIGEIVFEESFRTSIQPYTVNFIVITY